MPVFGYSKGKLAKQVIEAIREIDPSLTARYDPVTSRVIVHDGSDDPEPLTQMALDVMYTHARRIGFLRRGRWIRAQVSGALEDLPLTPRKLLASLRIRERTPYEIALKKRHAAKGGVPIEIVTRSAGDLLIEPVSDRAEVVASYPPEEFVDAGVSEDEAFRVAVAAMARMTDAGQWKEIEQGIWKSTYADDYDFARLVALGDDAPLPFEGAPIVFAPSHAVCLVTDRDDPATLGRIVRLGGEIAADHRPFSQLLWNRTAPNEWREFRPADDHPAAPVAAAQRLSELSCQYEEQKELLQQEFDDRGEDVFVASFAIAVNEDRRFTISTYTLDIPTYLPKTEVVGVVDPHAATEEGELGLMPWAEFESALGAGVLKPMPDEDPPRYMLLDPLGAIQKSALKERGKSFEELLGD